MYRKWDVSVIMSQSTNLSTGKNLSLGSHYDRLPALLTH